MDDATKELCRFYEKRITGLEAQVDRYKNLVDLDKIEKITNSTIENLEVEFRKEKALLKYTINEKERIINRLEADNASLTAQVKRLQLRVYELLPNSVKRELGLIN